METPAEIKENHETGIIQDGVKRLEILRGQIAPNIEYNPFVEDKLSIEAAHEYLSKIEADAEKIEDSYIVYSYENLYLKLIFGNRARISKEEQGDFFTGALVPHPDLKNWAINEAKNYDNVSLSNFIKMNRHFFESKEVAMALVTELNDLDVKTENEAKLMDDQRGNYRKVAAQRVINSNIPADFILNIPVFVGQPAVPFKVEVVINPHDFKCNLISPDLKEYIYKEAQVLIDVQLTKIRALYPKLRIYQK